jgi:hypothetical protein
MAGPAGSTATRRAAMAMIAQRQLQHYSTFTAILQQLL